MNFLRFIRWCQTTKNIYERLKKIEYKKTILYNEDKLNIKYIVRISALRSIIDRIDYKDREDIINSCFKDYLPEKLFNLLTDKSNNKLELCLLIY